MWVSIDGEGGREAGRITIIAPLNDWYSGGCCYRPVIRSPLHLSPRCRGGTCKPQSSSQTPLAGFRNADFLGGKTLKERMTPKETKKEPRGAASHVGFKTSSPDFNQAAFYSAPKSGSLQPVGKKSVHNKNGLK